VTPDFAQVAADFDDAGTCPASEGIEADLQQ
jgi:hypothetical protein